MPDQFAGQGDPCPQQRKASVMLDVKVRETKIADPKVKGALESVRASTQELHGAISDAAAKRGGAVKDDITAIPPMAKAIADSLKTSMTSQNAATKKALGEAVTNLEATQKHSAEALKSSGQAFQTSVRQTLGDARAAAQKVSEALAAERSAKATQSPKK